MAGDRGVHGRRWRDGNHGHSVRGRGTRADEHAGRQGKQARRRQNSRRQSAGSDPPCAFRRCAESLESTPIRVKPHGGPGRFRAAQTARMRQRLEPPTGPYPLVHGRPLGHCGHASTLPAAQEGLTIGLPREARRGPSRPPQPASRHPSKRPGRDAQESLADPWHLRVAGPADTAGGPRFRRRKTRLEIMPSACPADGRRAGCSPRRRPSPRRPRSTRCRWIPTCRTPTDRR